MRITVRYDCAQTAGWPYANDRAKPTPAAPFRFWREFPLGGEIESRLAYTQESEGQNLPERPIGRVQRPGNKLLLCVLQISALN